MFNIPRYGRRRVSANIFESNSRLCQELWQLQLIGGGRRGGSKFPADVDIVCDPATSAPSELKKNIKDTLCIKQITDS
jgi:hypothetical protein